MQMHKFVILAVADISKSLQNAKDDENIQQNQRNMSIAENDERDSNEPQWNRQTSPHGRLKFILKPQSTQNNTSNAEELISAFEYDGSIVKWSGIDQKSLVGCILQVNSPLDICRGILLLKASDCQVNAPNINMGVSSINNTDGSNAINRNTNIHLVENSYVDSGIDDELMAELFDAHNEEFTFD